MFQILLMFDFVQMKAISLHTTSVLRRWTLEDRVRLDESNSAIRGCDKFLSIFSGML